jgi:hypothetical protein
VRAAREAIRAVPIVGLSTDMIARAKVIE